MSSQSPPPPNGAEEKQTILDTYQSLSSRRVDLVGDYAGNELFMIEGDSLLLHCFSDSHLDFDYGFQVAHATYLVEQFLHHLEQRKCNFHLVFFEKNKKLCVPAEAKEENLSKYLLARIAIIRHLQAHLPDSSSRLMIFNSITAQDFQDYLAETGLYFMMCHDGAASKASEGGDATRRTSQMQQLRQMILSFISKGYNVALVNGLEWRDTKVLTMVLERSRNTGSLAILDTESENGVDTEDEDLLEPQDVSTLNNFPSLSEREFLAAAVVAKMLQQAAQQTEGVSQEELSMTAVTFLTHIALLKELPISSRRIAVVSTSTTSKHFLNEFSTLAAKVLGSQAWKQVAPAQCDLADVVDGRLFAACQANVGDLPARSRESLQQLCDAVKTMSGIALHSPGQASTVDTTPKPTEEDKSSLTVLPFSNVVFDHHLQSIHLDIDSNPEIESMTAGRVFKELTHWHNSKRPITQKGPAPGRSAKEEFWAMRRNQWFMAEMQKYAASLTNAVGKSLEPETVVVGSAPRYQAIEPPRDSNAKVSKENDKPKQASASAVPTKKKLNKIDAKNAEKQKRMASIAASFTEKQENTEAKTVEAWRLKCKEFAAEQDLGVRYLQLKEYLASLASDKAAVLDAEVRLFMLSTLTEHWVKHSQSLDTAALIWHTARETVSSQGLTKTIYDQVVKVTTTLALPSVSQKAPKSDRPLPFTFARLPPTTSKINLKPKDFQLLHCGPYLDRSIDSAADPRVPFEPDGWQRRVLDGIDANKSLFVVAPTSAGKTFISFYAMRKVLESDDGGILVYVAPTKALVNQIAAEIQARFSKTYKYAGKSVWAIHTRDYRINNPTGCQVLVTVPHILQIMLLAPSHANSWATKVKRIIFDEVHSIGNAEDGLVWEQLLLLAPCPIIALSATVGNPSEFSQWLSNTQGAIGNEVVTEGTTQRYSDLRKFSYTPQTSSFSFKGLPEKASFGKLGLDGVEDFTFVHPVASLVNKSRGIPDDLSLEPRDCLTLWAAMHKHQNTSYTVPDSLNPANTLREGFGKKDVVPWAKGLLDLLKAWMRDGNSPFDKVLMELSSIPHRQEQVNKDQITSVAPARKGSMDDLTSSTLPLLCSLHKEDALPAILFNYDRSMCEKICKALLEQLAEAETAWKEGSKSWKARVEGWEKWKKTQEDLASKKAKTVKVSKKKGSAEDRDDGADSSKLDRMRDAGGAEDSKYALFDPAAPVDGFHFSDSKRCSPSELEEYIGQLRWKHVPEWLISALTRGIGVHHAGMNRKYRQIVEILFRKGFLRVVIATGTLALGINMPCKTVVFSGDSVFLTALNFRQAAGRAGRRGFDLLGNVVFQGISDAKICRLMSSRLPDLNGHFPVTTTLVLRLFTLLHESNNASYAKTAISTLLAQPRLYMGGPAFRDQTLHHLRFSIEYLRRQRLLDSKGATLNFAGLVSHLYYTENSSFAFHALLKEGYFHQLCANIDKQEIDTMETLMLVMAHLFGRQYCRQSDQEFVDEVVKRSSSMVFLPPLPTAAARVLKEHAEDTLQVFRTYVKTFVDQHVEYADNKLPLTGVAVGAPERLAQDNKQNGTQDEDVVDEWDAQSSDDVDSGAKAGVTALDKVTLAPTKIRSSFVSLSGHSDKFTSISDLCRTTRSGVFLEESVIPHVGSYPDDVESPLNAYLLDFYKHGDITTLDRANKIRKSDVWFLLNDFSMVLATIITSLMNFLKLKPSNDLEMLDVMGDLEIWEEQEDDKLVEKETPTPAITNLPEMAKTSSTVKAKKQGKKLDSWEDDDDADVEEARADKGVSSKINGANPDLLAAWEGEVGEKGLLNVLKAFQKVQLEFNTEFKAIFA